jgi:3-dehydroquinate dehydratase / shikimate dehydrogenase
VNSSPRICLSLYGTTIEICNAIESFDADLYEIRLDLSATDLDGAAIRNVTKKPLLFASHGRPDLLEQYWPFADYVDVEQREATGRNLIVSVHAKDRNPEELWNQFSGEHMTKIVVDTADYNTVHSLLELNSTNRPLAICFAAGETGAFSRILSAFKGAPWIYACEQSKPTGNAQFSFEELTETYKLRRFDTTEAISVFGIIGNPVSHSRSPEIQNHYFAEASLPWIYLPFFCTDLRSLFANAEKWNTKGFSITHPYKEEVLSLLDTASPAVEQFKSCNTVARVGGRWVGTNTDLDGINALMEDVPLAGARAVILGAGASARAIASVIRPHLSELLILNRTTEKAEELARQFDARSGSLKDLKEQDYDLLIQATSIGWEEGAIPIDPSHLRSGKIVIESIYKDTVLLKKARELACQTIDGGKWFQVQALAQFRFWVDLFGVKPEHPFPVS